MKAIALLFLLGGAVGCGRYAVRADEKEFLADRIMQADFDTMELANDQHVLSNREGAQGGVGRNPAGNFHWASIRLDGVRGGTGETVEQEAVAGAGRQTETCGGT